METLTQLFAVAVVLIGIGFLFYHIGRAALPILYLALFVCIMFSMGGCVSGSGQNYAEVGMGYNASFTNTTHQWEDGGAGPTGATLEVGREWDVTNNEGLMKVKCRWLHLSHWFVGPPFNNRAESSVDHFGCAARVNF